MICFNRRACGLLLLKTSAHLVFLLYMFPTRRQGVGLSIFANTLTFRAVG